MKHNGWADEGFGPVADEFSRNFDEFGELGAAVSLFVDGRQVVNLWGGIADERDGRAWEADTAAPVFSTAKGIVTICALHLAQEGRLDLDAPMAGYWPEFGQRGKEGITLRMVLAHRAGLPVLDLTPGFDEIMQWDPVVRALEVQEPYWEPGTAHEYHGHTFGWLVGEAIRRITGLTPGAYFRKAIADELGLRTWIGVPQEEVPRLARLTEAEGRPGLPGPESIFYRILTMNGEFVFPGIDDPRGWNSPAMLTAEVPATGAVSSAGGLAALYAVAATGVDGRPRLLSHETITDAVREQTAGASWGGIPDMGARWGTGFTIDSPGVLPLLGARSFGHEGSGGSVAFGDDEFGVGFAYVPNRMVGHGDPRARRLMAAVQGCVKG
ncbi:MULTISPECIES: serine hydrolase domain-containing protein [Streptomyces]|uniref:Beta-lactamase family protein n=1 Tax=Streptomyces morookaense TaxID=1970 RepID=A0A7Y7AZH1_STRMO|nr:MULTISPECIES: serine hydrolase domain-containing protein [Streptomyces]MCC2276884.1 beta-lactamase family protein [Streptomyces sp. ET3-23]NVK76177.1 beta-lactamase family protein [Streptomyces morookaense]GHF37918.1 esterase [Streptomyces morookaense]